MTDKKREEVIRIRTIQRDNFRKGIKMLMASRGYVNNEEMAKFLGFEKSWLDNLMVKRDNVRIPTLPDLFKIYKRQERYKQKGIKAAFLDLHHIMYDEPDPEKGRLLERIEALEAEKIELKTQNSKLSGQVEAYKSVWSKKT